jgi:uncharacterized protein
MLRFILLLLLILILYSVLHYLIKDMPLLRKRVSPEDLPEELVQDPYCKTYIPKRSALKKKIAGRIHYFCSRECMKKYLQREK